MANKIKEVNKALPAQERYVSFASSELTDLDVIKVYESLGRAADTMSITIVGDGLALKIRINSRVTVYPRRKYPEQEPFGYAQYAYPNIAAGQELETGVAQIDVAARGVGTHVFSGLSIRDVEIDTSAGTGTFNIVLS